MTTFIYIDRQGFIVWLDHHDNVMNRSNKALRRYEFPARFTNLFIQYYKLEIHPEALKNVVHAIKLAYIL